MCSGPEFHEVLTVAVAHHRRGGPAMKRRPARAAIVSAADRGDRCARRASVCFAAGNPYRLRAELLQQQHVGVQKARPLSAVW